LGTNYYHHANICECCGRYDEHHICKSLINFAAILEWDETTGDEKIVCASWQEWKKRLLEGGEIWDEYRKQHDIPEFIAKVESMQKDARRRQYDWERDAGFQVAAGPNTNHQSWLDEDGFTFTAREFS
jgi:hypothetical protein